MPARVRVRQGKWIKMAKRKQKIKSEKQRKRRHADEPDGSGNTLPDGKAGQNGMDGGRKAFYGAWGRDAQFQRIGSAVHG